MNYLDGQYIFIKDFKLTSLSMKLFHKFRCYFFTIFYKQCLNQKITHQKNVSVQRI